MIIDNLANRLHIGQISGGGGRFALVLAGLLFVCAASLSSGAPPKRADLPAWFPGQRERLDASCNGRPDLDELDGSRAGRALLALKCDMVPLYNKFLAQYHARDWLDAIDDDAQIARELNQLRDRIENFFRMALDAWSLRDHCSYVTYTKLQELRTLAGDNRLLALVYDLLSIEQHAHCLGETIAKLPAVPYLVKDIVKIYIDGADTPLPDLNEPAPSDMGADDDTPFDVDAAIAKNGPLEQVVGLSLSMFGRSANNTETAWTFRESCKDLLATIEQRWEGMQMMSLMTATDGNAIKQVNNYALRTLSPTKFADICSKISSRS